MKYSYFYHYSRSMIDYIELFKQHFDPRISLLDKIKEKVPNLENRIHLDDQLNIFAKDDVYNIISGKYEHNSDLLTRMTLFMPNTYSKFLSKFQFHFNDNQENLKNAIVDATFDDLNSQNILDKFSDQNIDLIGIYLFISKKGFVVCSVNCAQSISNDDPFSPEAFLEALKKKGKCSSDLFIDDELQKLAEKFVPEFEDLNRNARQDFKTFFQKKYSYNSAYSRFTVPTNQNEQIVNSIFSNSDASSFFKQEFDRIGFSLFHVGNQNQILIIVSNSHIEPPQNLEELNGFGDEDSGGDLFDDDDDNEGDVDNFIETFNKENKNKAQARKLKKNDESDYDATDSGLLRYNRFKANPIPHKQTNENSSNLNFSSFEGDDDNFDDLYEFRKNSPAKTNQTPQPSLLSPILNTSEQNKLGDADDIFDDDDFEDNSSLGSPEKDALNITGSPIQKIKGYPSVIPHQFSFSDNKSENKEDGLEQNSIAKPQNNDKKPAPLLQLNDSNELEGGDFDDDDFL